ncbi:MAG: hypothetical protein L3K14_07565 [Thermoplasmata archaeon]|nr:hypothetical protein [Thermoplasmata archaeon]
MDPLAERIGRLRRLAGLAVVALMVSVAWTVPAPAHATPNYPALMGAISGPTVVGRGLQVQYVVTGTGGPAFTLSGTQVGNITYNATVSGANVSTASIRPATGTLANGQAVLRFTAANLTEAMKVNVELTSSYHSAHASSNLTLSIQVVQPYLLSGTLIAGATTVAGFNMTVTVDGTPVGQVSVPAIAANGSYTFTFDYVPQSLAPGWHTIAISVAPQHGLVTFVGGVQELSAQFYITSPPPNYALDVGVGIAALAAAFFIWGSVVGARRRGRRVR